MLPSVDSADLMTPSLTSPRLPPGAACLAWELWSLTLFIAATAPQLSDLQGMTFQHCMQVCYLLSSL